MLSKIDPALHAVIAGLIAQVEAEVRTPGNPTGANQYTDTSGPLSVTEDSPPPREPVDYESSQGIRRRLQKRANQGDAQAQELVAQLASNAISANQAAIQAGMRAEYFRIPKDDPIRAAARIREKLGDSFADALQQALACSQDGAD